MAVACSSDFRVDVLIVARGGDVSVSQVAQDFGISDTCVRKWLKADVGNKGVSAAQSVNLVSENAVLKKRNKLLE